MIGLSLGVGLGSGRLIPADPPTIPAFLGFASTVDGSDPTIPAHVSGNLLVAAAANNNTHSSLLPTLASPWVLPTNGSAIGGTNRAVAGYHTTATGAGHTASWSDANIPRVAWAFEDADFDVAMTIEAASSTTVDWPQLSGMAADCIIGVVFMSRAAQTSMAATVGADMIALGFTQRLTRNSAPACWVGDTNTTLLDSFNPANSTLDTISNGHVAFVFSVKVSS